MTSTSVMVRKMAIGSLVPDSISSVERTRSRRLTVAGAQQEEHRRRIGRGDSRAEQEGFQPGELGQVEGGGAEQASVVSTTPTVASESAGSAACRSTLSGVPKPESNRMTASASEPTK